MTTELFVAHEDGAFRCYTTRTGIDRTYLGCRHETPRQAVRHTAPTFVPASRSGREPYPGAVPGQNEAPVPTPSAGSLAGASHHTPDGLRDTEPDPSAHEPLGLWP